jgi:hypothetical protein
MADCRCCVLVLLCQIWEVSWSIENCFFMLLLEVTLHSTAISTGHLNLFLWRQTDRRRGSEE